MITLIMYEMRFTLTTILWALSVIYKIRYTKEKTLNYTHLISADIPCEFCFAISSLKVAVHTDTFSIELSNPSFKKEQGIGVVNWPS